MNCSLCGAVIPDGQSVCPNCGNQIQPMGGYQQPVQPMGGYQQPVQPMGGYQQPVQPMGGYQQPVQPMGGYQQQAQPMGGYQQQAQPMGGYQQPMGGYQQPMGGYQQPMGGYQQSMGGGFNGYLNGLLADGMRIIGLIGAILLFITPLLPWAKMKLWGEKETQNMFGIGSDFGIFTFFGIMFMLISVILILFDIAEMIPALSNIKMKLSPYLVYIECGLIVLALLFIILGLANGDVNEVLEYVEDWGGKASHGSGPVFGFIAVILAAVPRVLNILHVNVNFGLKR